LSGWTDITYTPYVDGTSSSSSGASSSSSITYTAHWPPQELDTYMIWDWIIQLWKALGEREAVLGAYTGDTITWPPSNIWGGGDSIDSATDNGDGTVTFAMTIPEGSWTTDCFSDPPYRWVGYVCTDPHDVRACVPIDYKLVIDPNPAPFGAINDPSKVVEMFITAETYSGGTTGSLTGSIGPINDMITAGLLGSLSDLEGCRWYIVDANGVFLSERIPQKPLARQKYQGTGTIGTTSGFPYLAPTSSSSSSSSGTQYNVLYDSLASWATDNWKDDDLLFYGFASRLKRVTVSHNDAQRIYYPLDSSSSSSGTSSSSSGTISTPYCITKPNAITYPGAPQDNITVWYRGASAAFYAHAAADDSLGTAYLAPLCINITVQDEDGDCSVIECSNAYDDPDVTYSLDTSDTNCMCLQGGQFYNPCYWQSIHAVQNEILRICTDFIPVGNYDDALGIPFYNPAILLQSVGANGGSSSISIVSGNMTFSVTGYDGYGLYYAILQSNGTYTAGIVTPASGVATLGADTSPTSAGKPVYYSAGNTREYKRRVKYLYNSVGNFIPDQSFDEDGDSTGYIDPPAPTLNDDGTYDCNGVGQFIKRPKSTSYALFNEPAAGTYGGLLVDNAGPAFVSGDLVCHEGDNQGASPIVPLTPAGADPSLTVYYDRMFRGTYAKVLKARREASMSGKILGSTKNSITTDKHWWMDGVNNGTMRTETSTATSGDSTHLVDTTRNLEDNTLPYGCYYSTGRFTFSAPYVGWILEVDKVYTGTDLTIDPSNNKKVTSGSHNFTDYEVNSQIVISSSSGWVAGTYTITSVDSNAAILDRSPLPMGTSSSSSGGGTGGSWSLTVISYQ
jgi:hypothetical protein